MFRHLGHRFRTRMDPVTIRDPHLDTLVRWILAALVILFAMGNLARFSTATTIALTGITLTVAALGHHPWVRGHMPRPRRRGWFRIAAVAGPKRFWRKT